MAVTCSSSLANDALVGKRSAAGPRVRVLQDDVPGSGAHRVQRDDEDRPGVAGPGRLAPQAALPRLLRAGLRRVCATRLHRRHAGGEGRQAQREPARLRRRRAGQGQAREGVPGHRLLRRRPRAHGTRRRRPEQGPVLAGGARPEGRPDVQRRQLRPAAAALREHHGHDRGVRWQGPRCQGPRRALRRAHAREGALLILRRPPLQWQHVQHRPDPGPPVCRQAANAVPWPWRQRGRDGGDGLRELLDVRHQLLPAGGQGAWAAPLGRRPHGASRHRCLCPPRRHWQVRRTLLPGLPRFHGQYGRHGRSHWRPGGDQDQVQHCQLNCSSL